jgi:hypothetical protein
VSPRRSGSSRLWPDLSPRLVELVTRLDQFIHETVIPAEPPGDADPGPAVRQRLRQAARQAGVFAPR